MAYTVRERIRVTVMVEREITDTGRPLQIWQVQRFYLPEELEMLTFSPEDAVVPEFREDISTMLTKVLGK